jgi:hypothetical protein
MWLHTLYGIDMNNALAVGAVEYFWIEQFFNIF